MPSYRALSQKHEEWTQCSPIWAEVEDLYEGGYRIRKNAKAYLHRMDGETPTRYAERLREASYIGYMGQIVDYFSSNLFGSELTITVAPDASDPNTLGKLPDENYYTSFNANCDRKGTPFSALIRESFTKAQLKRRAIVGVDFPRVETVPTNRAEENALGKAQAYLYEVPCESLTNWDYDDEGNFAWAVLHRVYPVGRAPTTEAGRTRVEFKVWRRGDNGSVIWELYAREYEGQIGPKDEDEFPLEASGPTDFKQIPLVEFELPAGLWVGNKIGTLACEHFRRRSTLNSAEAKSLHEIGVYQLGPEMSAQGEALPAEVQQDPHRDIDPRLALHGKGWITIGAQDKLSYVGPSGTAFELTDKQLSDLKDEMFRVTFQMAASVGTNATALGRSGDSKSEDRRAESIVLSAFGDRVRKFATKIWKVISDARKEPVVWVAHGLDRFETDDRATVVAEAVQADTVGIPSATFKKLHKTRLALALVNAPPETQQTIRQEIEDGVDKEFEAAEHMHAIQELAMQEPEVDEGEPPAKKAAVPPPMGKPGPKGQPKGKGPQNGKAGR